MKETLDLKWWHSLTAKEQAKYLKAHPDSKYNDHIHLADMADPPFDWKRFPGRLRDLRLVKFPYSKYANDDLDARWKYHQKAGHKSEYMDVPVEKLVATQPVVDVRWTPTRSANSGPITGLMNKNGYVHLYDGHHRSDYLASKGHKKIRVLVYRHSADDEKRLDKDIFYESSSCKTFAMCYL